ncbi:MAG: ParB/RepB/Spo0J family partition protein, partial [Chloroflexota bacterium]
EDLSPLDEAVMYDRMVREHGYSLRKLAQKLGKDKGYLENRLRLADAPPEIRELVSLRKDTLSHAYELMKVEDPRKRRKLAEQVARGELTLIKLKERIDGRPTRRPRKDRESAPAEAAAPASEGEAAWTGQRKSAAAPLTENSLVAAKQEFAEALEAMVEVLRSPDVISGIDALDRANLAKYLTIAKLRLENAIAMVRSGDVS